MRKVTLVLIFILAFGLRLYRLNSPLADWHSWRQVDTAAVSRRYCQDGIKLLQPRFDDLSNIPSGQDNPQGWRMVEFPIYNALHCQLSRLLPSFSFEASGRLLSIGFSLFSLILLYLLVKKLSGFKLAIISTFFWAVLPFNLYYSRVILPEPLLISLTLAGLYFGIGYLEDKHWLKGGLSVVSLVLALLIKPYVVFFGLPLVYLAWRNKKFQLLLPYLLALIPFYLWRQWIQQFSEGIPAYMWLLNQNNIRLRPAWWRWLFADRLGRLILGYWGLIPFGLGMVTHSNKKTGWFYHWWLVGAFAYLAVFAMGNVTHDYYQAILIPLICIILAKGVLALADLSKREYFSCALSYLLLGLSATLMLAFSWFYVRDFFNINHPEIVAAGQVADQLLPAEAKVIAPYGGDTAFLYQTKRQGWPIGFEIQDKIDKGATHYVSVTLDDEANWLSQQCQVLAKTDQLIIIDLLSCPEELL